MKTARQRYASRKVAREVTHEDYEQAVRSCEAVTQRIKSASEDLAESWAAFARELSSGVSATDLLRKRAWCNVLELRLKDQVHALEEARKRVDQVWDDMLLARRARELFNRYLKRDEPEPVEADTGFSLLARTAIAIAAEHRNTPVTKK